MFKRTARPKMKRDGFRPKKRSVKFQIPPDQNIDYKNIGLIQKFVTDRGKIISRRITGVNGKEQRSLSSAIKRARYLGLLPVGGAKKR